jgi:hypothetical protein
MKLRDLARYSQDPTSFLTALRVFLFRSRSKETTRRSRRSHESVPVPSTASQHLTLCSNRSWLPFIALFLVLSILAPALPFLFGRIMIIETFTRVCDTTRLYLVPSSFLNRTSVRYTMKFSSLGICQRTMLLEPLPNLRHSRLARNDHMDSLIPT